MDVVSPGALPASSGGGSAGVIFPSLAGFRADPCGCGVCLEHSTVPLQSRAWLVALGAPRLGAHGAGDSLCAQNSLGTWKYCYLRTAVHVLRGGLDLSLLEKSCCPPSSILWLPHCRHCCFHRRIRIPVALRSRTAGICWRSHRTLPKLSL